MEKSLETIVETTKLEEYSIVERKILKLTTSLERFKMGVWIGYLPLSEPS